MTTRLDEPEGGTDLAAGPDRAVPAEAAAARVVQGVAGRAVGRDAVRARHPTAPATTDRGRQRTVPATTGRARQPTGSAHRAGDPTRDRRAGDRTRDRRALAVTTVGPTTNDRARGGSARRLVGLDHRTSARRDPAHRDPVPIGSRSGPPGGRPRDDHRGPAQGGAWNGPTDRPFERGPFRARPWTGRIPTHARAWAIGPRSGTSSGALGSIRPRPRPAVRSATSDRRIAPPALPPPDVLGDDEELIAGRRPVEEAFVARRPAHRLLVVPQRRHALEKLVLHATSLRLPIVELEGGSLTALAGFDGHQGVALVVEPRRYATLEEILARAAERGEAPFVLALDSLEDPQNVGTLLRSAEAAGVHGVLFPTHRQAPLTPSAVKASAGAVEHLLLAPVDDLARALTDLRGHGLRVAGAEANAPLTARQSDLRGPLVIVVGSEGQGLGPTVRRRADLFMRIPMRGAVGSLNAAVAGSILLFEAVAQRDPEGRWAPPQPIRSQDPEAAIRPDEGVEVASVPAEVVPTAPQKRGRRIAKPTDATGAAEPTELATATVAGDELLPGERPTGPTPKPTAKPKATIKPKATAKSKARGKPKASAEVSAATPKATDQAEGHDQAEDHGQAESRRQAEGSRQAKAVTGSRPGRSAQPRLTHAAGRPYHLPAPERVICGMALPVVPT